MNQETKLKLEQAAETAWEQDQKTNPTPVNPHAYVYGYKAGAQTILENPEEWGLCPIEDYQKLVGTLTDATKILLEKESQLTKYREALERIITPVHGEYPNIENVNWIAKEALKQQ